MGEKGERNKLSTLRNWFEPKKEIYNGQERALLWINSIKIAHTHTRLWSN